MISNLKVDIIYYKTSSDFELEFNLSGCCRMRIFKEKVENYKELVNTLARDVNRSRVIIVVTDLIGSKNGVEIVSSAVGYKYEPIDKSAYSIKSGDNIKVPKGCLPLVTNSGQYGGCIIECGKQSIIFVSSDRPLRHEVMRSYIHQYIFDINQVEAYNERLRHERGSNPILDQSNILSTARQELAPQPVQESTDSNGTAESADEATEENTVESSPAETESETANGIADTDTAPTEEAENEKSSSASEPDTESAAENGDSSDTGTDEAESGDSDDVIRSSSEGFVAMLSSNTESDTSEDDKLDRRLRPRRRGTDIALLIVVILLLVCFGLLAYYFVYLPIVGEELPNDLVEIINEVTAWLNK